MKPLVCPDGNGAWIALCMDYCQDGGSGGPAEIGTYATEAAAKRAAAAHVKADRLEQERRISLPPCPTCGRPGVR